MKTRLAPTRPRPHKRPAGERPSSRPVRHRPAFTLVELLVVITIIGILIALLLPAVQAAREAARRTQCANNLKQLALGLLNYESSHGCFPPAEIHGGSWNADYDSYHPPAEHCDWNGQIGCWMNLIFPFIEQQAAYDKLDFDVRPQYDSADNRQIMQMIIPLFYCPSDSFRGLSGGWGPGGETTVPENKCRTANYFAVLGTSEDGSGDELTHPDGAVGYSHHCHRGDGMFYNDSAVTMAEIRDGTANTAALAETFGRAPTEGTPTLARGMNVGCFVAFDQPINSRIDLDPWKVNCFHSGGCFMAFADGSVHFIAETIDWDTYQGLATIAGREVLDGLGF